MLFECDISRDLYLCSPLKFGEGKSLVATPRKSLKLEFPRRLYLHFETCEINLVSKDSISESMFIVRDMYRIFLQTFELREVQDFTEDWLTDQLAR